MQQNALGSGHPQFWIDAIPPRAGVHPSTALSRGEATHGAGDCNFERTRVPTHPDNVIALGEYARLLRRMGRKPEAKSVEKKIAAIKGTGTWTTSAAIPSMYRRCDRQPQ